jgi:diguanylate cyclase (GGDEF)-like protein
MFCSADELESRYRRLAAELAAARSKIRELESRVETDALLDILNRRGFERELTRAISQVNRYRGSAAVVFIDLDNFKSINDRFGHLAGDAALKAVAEVIINNCRGSDIVARFGGDEFAVLLWSLSQDDARTKARSFETKIGARNIRLAANFFSVGASAGVTMLERSDSPSQVIGRADKDMYARKMEKKAERRHLLAACGIEAQDVLLPGEGDAPRNARMR